jgi:hypothetical protein
MNVSFVLPNPPVYTPPFGLAPFPLYDCTVSPCVWRQTSLVLDGGNREFDRFGVRSITGGLNYRYTGLGSRAYVVDPSGQKHFNFQLLNRRLEFEIELKNAPCGHCSAVYFSDMKFGQIGREYCDAQGTCAEYDVIEANRAAVAQASHSCANGICDKWGCSINSRRLGEPIGFNKYIDTTKKMRVATTFRTENGRDDGTLVAIEQVYYQEGKFYQLPTITDAYCLNLGAANPQFPSTGRLKAMSDAMRRGKTMIFSLWTQSDMSWLDGGASNPSCQLGERNNPVQYSFTNLAIFRL